MISEGPTPSIPSGSCATFSGGVCPLGPTSQQGISWWALGEEPSRLWLLSQELPPQGFPPCSIFDGFQVSCKDWAVKVGF